SGLLSWSIEDVAAGRLAQDDVIALQQWHGDRLELVLPQRALVEGVPHSLPFIERREAPQPHELVRVLEIEQRPEDFHSMAAQRRHRPRLEEPDELLAAPRLDPVATDFYYHGRPPNGIVEQADPSRIGRKHSSSHAHLQEGTYR